MSLSDMLKMRVKDLRSSPEAQQILKEKKEKASSRKKSREDAVAFIQINFSDENAKHYFWQDTDVAKKFEVSLFFVKSKREEMGLPNRQERLASSIMKLRHASMYVQDIVDSLNERVSYYTIVKCLQAYGLKYLRKGKND